MSIGACSRQLSPTRRCPFSMVVTTQNVSNHGYLFIVLIPFPLSTGGFCDIANVRLVSKQFSFVASPFARLGTTWRHVELLENVQQFYNHCEMYSSGLLCCRRCLGCGIDYKMSDECMHQSVFGDDLERFHGRPARSWDVFLIFYE